MANYFHESVLIGKLASIDISSRGTHTYIGANSQIDDFVKIKHVGGLEDVKIGRSVYLNSGTVLYSGNGIKIGDNVLIGPNCSITPINHKYHDKYQTIHSQGFMESKGGVIIESDVWIGANVTLLDGAHVQEGAVIGANSLVIGKVEPYSINIGVPSQIVGYRS